MYRSSHFPHSIWAVIRGKIIGTNQVMTGSSIAIYIWAFLQLHQVPACSTDKCPQWKESVEMWSSSTSLLDMFVTCTSRLCACKSDILCQCALLTWSLSVQLNSYWSASVYWLVVTCEVSERNVFHNRCSNVLHRLIPVIRSWSVTDTDWVLCTYEDCYSAEHTKHRRIAYRKTSSKLRYKRRSPIDAGSHIEAQAVRTHRPIGHPYT